MNVGTGGVDAGSNAGPEPSIDIPFPDIDPTQEPSIGIPVPDVRGDSASVARITFIEAGLTLEE